MFIKQIINTMGNDFSATMQCEHCGNTHMLNSGYHDTHYHTRVIPAMTCRACGKNRAGDTPVEPNTNGLTHVPA